MPIMMKAAVGALLLLSTNGAFARSLLKEDETSVTDLFTTKPEVRDIAIVNHCSWISWHCCSPGRPGLAEHGCKQMTCLVDCNEFRGNQRHWTTVY